MLQNTKILKLGAMNSRECKMFFSIVIKYFNFMNTDTLQFFQYTAIVPLECVLYIFGLEHQFLQTFKNKEITGKKLEIEDNRFSISSRTWPMQIYNKEDDTKSNFIQVYSNIPKSRICA